MITVGPHRFTAQDAHRTLEAFDTLWGLLGGGADGAAVIASLRPSTSGDVEADLRAAWAALLAAGPALRAAGLLPGRATGTVDALHLGDGGVPKHGVDRVDVDWSGVVGDRQATRRHHGRPNQALCLWSSEVIATLQADGHPIAPGSTGENITVRGLRWADVRPGVRLRIGTVTCEVSSYAVPCSQNSGWFLDGRFRVIHHSNGPVSRVYATVLAPGGIAVGDDVILEP